MYPDLSKPKCYKSEKHNSLIVGDRSSVTKRASITTMDQAHGKAHVLPRVRTNLNPRYNILPFPLTAASICSCPFPRCPLFLSRGSTRVRGLSPGTMMQQPPQPQPGMAPAPPPQAAGGQPPQWGGIPPPMQQQYGAPPPQQSQPPAMWGQPPPQAPYAQAVPPQPYYAAAPQAPAAAPAASDEVRTLWIGDLQYWMDENYVFNCFAPTGEVCAPI